MPSVTGRNMPYPVPGVDSKLPDAANIRDFETSGFNNSIYENIHPITLLSQCFCMILVKMTSPGMMWGRQNQDPRLFISFSSQNS